MMQERLEMRGERKHSTKFITAETKAIGQSNGDFRVHAVVSTEAQDRDGDIIRAAGWNLDNFMKHPVLIASHNYRNLTNQIGRWDDMSVKGKRLVGIARYFVNRGNPEADWGYALASMGEAAFSVGFIPDMDKAKVLNENDFWPNFEFNGQELLEVSHVVVPSNAEALQTAKSLAGLHPVVDRAVDHALAVIELEAEGDEDKRQGDEVLARQIALLLERQLLAPAFIERMAERIADRITGASDIPDAETRSKVDDFNRAVAEALAEFESKEEVLA